MPSSLDSLAAGFLIAAPALQDPNFDHALVLMCVHNEDGAMGLVVNRSAPITTRELMLQMGIECPAGCSQTVLIGGPVALESGVVVYRPAPGAVLRDDEIAITDDLRLCPSQDLLRAIANGDGPEHYHLFLGHSGWAPGQLEQEIAEGAWIPGGLRLDLVFDTPLEQRWTAALAAEGISPAMLGSFRPGN